MALVTVQRSADATTATAAPNLKLNKTADTDDNNSADSADGLDSHPATYNSSEELSSKSPLQHCHHRSLNEFYFASRGSAVVLPPDSARGQQHHRQQSVVQRRTVGSGSGGGQYYKGGTSGSDGGQPDIQHHLQSMFYLVRREETLSMAVRLESEHHGRTRYLAVITNDDESCLLGIDCTPTAPSSADVTSTVGLVLRVLADAAITLDGDGGFSFSTGHQRQHVFKPVSVQAMWSALQTLHRACARARRLNHFAGGQTHAWTQHYEQNIASRRSCLNEWHAMAGLETRRPPSPGSARAGEDVIRNKLKEVMMSVDLDVVTSKYIRGRLEQQLEMDLSEYRSFIDQEMLTILAENGQNARNALFELNNGSRRSCLNEWPSPGSARAGEDIIRNKLKEVMMSVDLDVVTSKYIRGRLEQQLEMDLSEYRSFIDQEMLTILGQMDAPTLVFDHVYLGSEWNASNLDELRRNGVRHILNVTREIDNFFPGLFDYLNVRVCDDDSTDLLRHWDDTFRYISRAKREGAKVLVHCKMGISRSASVVIAYAMKAFNWDLQRALEHVRERRSCVKPNASFIAQLETYQGMLAAMRNREKLQRSRSEACLANSQLGREQVRVVPVPDRRPRSWTTQTAAAVDRTRPSDKSAIVEQHNGLVHNLRREFEQKHQQQQQTTTLDRMRPIYNTM